MPGQNMSCFVSDTSRLETVPLIRLYSANCVMPRWPPKELGEKAEKTSIRVGDGYSGTMYAATGMMGKFMTGLHDPRASLLS